MTRKILTAGGMVDVDQYLSLKPAIYLAGAIQRHPDGGVAWRENIIEKFPDVGWVNPHDLNRSGKDPEEMSEAEQRMLVDCEKAVIGVCHGLLVMWPEDVPMCGTPMEIHHAAERGKYIAVWYVGRRDPPMWLETHADLITRDLPDAVDAIRDQFT